MCGIGSGQRPQTCALTELMNWRTASCSLQDVITGIKSLENINVGLPPQFQAPPRGNIAVHRGEIWSGGYPMTPTLPNSDGLH